MENNKKLVLSILQYLDEQQRSPYLSPDAIESLEVASQCLESAYNVSIRDVDLVSKFNIPASLPEIFSMGLNELTNSLASPTDKESAEKLKAEGNEFMRQEQYEPAVNAYTEAIRHDPRNSVYFCNRAAALAKLGDHEKSIEDCLHAINIDPNYAKAYGRKGLAHTALGQHQEAKECFQKASELDPSNESYKDNLKLSDQMMTTNAGSPAGGFAGLNLGGMDLGSLLNNPALMNMATTMLSNPQMQTMMASMMSGLNGQASDPGASPISGLLQAGQQLAQQMQQSNPELVERLRNQMTNDQPSPGTNDPNQNNPEDK